MEALLNLIPYGNYVMVAVGICALLATVIPDTNPVGKWLHLIAMNFGKAKNAEPVAPAAQAQAADPSQNRG